MHSWRELFEQEMAKPYWSVLQGFLKEERNGKGLIFPEYRDTYKALLLTPLKKVRVVIIGQDPYHGYSLLNKPGEPSIKLPQAHGLAFSVQEGTPYPPSLRNILTELKEDLGVDRSSGDLTKWAQQGVLLLNSVLTVQEGKPGSHSKKGWEKFTGAALEAVAENQEHVAFVRWGGYAMNVTQNLEIKPELYYKHHWLQSTHPSPLSYNRGQGKLSSFKGSRPFSKINKYLVEELGEEPIDWSKV